MFSLTTLMYLLKSFAPKRLFEGLDNWAPLISVQSKISLKAAGVVALDRLGDMK